MDAVGHPHLSHLRCQRGESRAPPTHMLQSMAVVKCFFLGLSGISACSSSGGHWGKDCHTAIVHEHTLPACLVCFIWLFFLFFSVFPNLTEFVAPWWPVYSDLHARAGAGGRLPLPDWLRTLLLLLAQGRLWPVPCLPGERVSAPTLSRLRPL